MAGRRVIRSRVCFRGVIGRNRRSRRKLMRIGWRRGCSLTWVGCCFNCMVEANIDLLERYSKSAKAVIEQACKLITVHQFNTSHSESSWVTIKWLPPHRCSHHFHASETSVQGDEVGGYGCEEPGGAQVEFVEQAVRTAQAIQQRRLQLDANLP